MQHPITISKIRTTTKKQSLFVKFMEPHIQKWSFGIYYKYTSSYLILFKIILVQLHEIKAKNVIPVHSSQ